MNKDNAKDYLHLVQALAEGRTIQHQYAAGCEWRDLADHLFSDPPCRYRIKPEPRRAWVWWPPVDSSADEIALMPEFFLYHGFAENAVKNYGGHITEVTE